MFDMDTLTYSSGSLHDATVESLLTCKMIQVYRSDGERHLT
jgi:hypothetical protein